MTEEQSDKTIKCEQCGMIFMSVLSLENHKEKFCIGIPDSGVNRDDFSLDNQSIYLPHSMMQGSGLDGSVYPQNDNSDKISLLKLDDDLSGVQTPPQVEHTPRQLAESPQPETQREDFLNRTYNKTPNTVRKSLNDEEIKSKVLMPQEFSKANTVLEDLQNYKSQKEIEQTFKDMEDMTIRDTIRDKKLVDSLQSSTRSSAKKDPYKSLMKEYSELKKKEKRVLQEIYNLKQINHEEPDDTEIFLNMLDAELANDNDEFNEITGLSVKQPKIKSDEHDIFKEKHKLQLKEIESKTLQLERERKNIEFKLESLKASSDSQTLPQTSKQSINRILVELKNQEKINETALQSLKTQLISEQILAPKKLSVSNTNTQIPQQYQDNKLNNMNPDELRSIRMNYLQKGGHDSAVLKQLGEMEYQTRLKQLNPLDTSVTTARNDFLSDFDLPSDTFNINTSLQNELDLLKRKYQTSTDDITNLIRNRTDYDTHIQQVKQLLQKYDKQNDFKLPPIPIQPVINYNMPRAPMESPYMSRKVTPLSFANSQIHPSRLSNVSRTQSQKLLIQQQPRLREIPVGPYDPIGGFLVFIDFVSNLDPSISTSRIITCLHHPKSGLGEPSVLPVVNCESYVSNGSQITIALYSTKQPVPRCPPQQALTILTELQLSSRGDRSANTNEAKLRSCAWTKIPLFDSKNRLLSGRWRIPLKALPIQSEMSLPYINNLEQFGNVELFYRLVNARDSNEQTNEAISPIYASSYNYPPQNIYQNNIQEESAALTSDTKNPTKITKKTSITVNNEKEVIESAKSSNSKVSIKR